MAKNKNKEAAKAASTTPPAEPVTQEPAVLIGSNKQPAEFKLKDGTTLSLGDVVAKAHELSGLSVEDWNKLGDEELESRIEAVVNGLDIEQTPVDSKMPRTVEPEEAVEGEETVTMVFPKDVKIMKDDHTVVIFREGVREVPVSLSDHWYLKANGATKYQPK